jgi:hypothetical protein
MKWEYYRHVVDLTRGPDDINKLGLQGWEAYHVSDSGAYRTYYLKRPLR